MYVCVVDCHDAQKELYIYSKQAQQTASYVEWKLIKMRVL